MKRDDPDDPEAVSAYAKLEFERFSFFVQTLHFTVGRKAKREDFVDVHLGSSKSISRIHVKIYYQFDAMSWEIEVLGKNGIFVNERHIEAGGHTALKNYDKIQIGETHFVFLLPDGAPAPIMPASTTNPFNTTDTPSAVGKNAASTQVVGASPYARTTGVPPTTPIAPRDLMQNVKSAVSQNADISKAKTNPSATLLNGNVLGGTKAGANGATTAAVIASAYATPNPSNQARTFPGSSNAVPSAAGQGYAKVDQSTSTRPTAATASSVLTQSGSQKAEPTTSDSAAKLLDNLVKAEGDRRAQEEAAAQLAAQLLQDERIARQAREEEEGLILPPAETDPAVIAALQKPSASYATMIYSAIKSHEKKKMTLAQIYSWICINHPYYRYILNGWQNSIRHNLSLNKAFMKVPRTSDEPGKGAFWAVDPNSEVLFEGGVYKKKPPRPVAAAPVNRGAPVVMKDGKLALNPNYFATGIQGKAEEVLEMLEVAVQRQIDPEDHENASQLARILALALATQLRQAAVAQQRTTPIPMAASMPRYMPTSLSTMPRPTTPSAFVRSPATVGLTGAQTPVQVTRPMPPQSGLPGVSMAASRAANGISTSSMSTATKPNLQATSTYQTTKPGGYQSNAVYYSPYQPANSSLNAAIAARSSQAANGTTPGGSTTVRAPSQGANTSMAKVGVAYSPQQAMAGPLQANVTSALGPDIASATTNSASKSSAQTVLPAAKTPTPVATTAGTQATNSTASSITQPLSKVAVNASTASKPSSPYTINKMNATTSPANAFYMTTNPIYKSSISGQVSGSTASPTGYARSGTASSAVNSGTTTALRQSVAGAQPANMLKNHSRPLHGMNGLSAGIPQTIKVSHNAMTGSLAGPIPAGIQPQPPKASSPGVAAVQSARPMSKTPPTGVSSPHSIPSNMASVSAKQQISQGSSTPPIVNHANPAQDVSQTTSVANRPSHPNETPSKTTVPSITTDTNINGNNKRTLEDGAESSITKLQKSESVVTQSSA